MPLCFVIILPSLLVKIPFFDKSIPRYLKFNNFQLTVFMIKLDNVRIFPFSS